MAEENTTPAETVEGDEQQEQAGTADQLAELQARLEQVTRAQAGSDKKVAELTKALTEAKQRAESAEKSAEERMAERLEALERKSQEAEQAARIAMQKNLATKLLSNAGLKAPSFVDRLIGDDDDATEAAISEYIEAMGETKRATAEEFAKKHGRRVTETEKGGGSSIFDYTDAQIESMSDEEFQAALERAKQ